MKSSIGPTSLMIVASTALGGCHLARELFHFGVWTTVIVIVVFLALLGGLLSFFRR